MVRVSVGSKVSVVNVVRVSRVRGSWVKVMSRWYLVLWIFRMWFVGCSVI